MVFVICQRLVIRHQRMVLEMMTNSWERGEATDSLWGFIWLYLDEDEAAKILKTSKHSFVTFFSHQVVTQ